MIRNGVDWGGVFVDATEDKDVHDAVIRLLERKTGLTVAHGWDIDSITHRYKIAGPYQLIGLARTNRSIMEMSISELAALPDYQTTKKMTVPEICEALGYDVEIVKGGE